MSSVRVKVDGMTQMTRWALAGFVGMALLAGCGGSEEDVSAPATGIESAVVSTIDNTEPTSAMVSEAQLDTQTAEALDDGDQPIVVEAAQAGMQVEIEPASTGRGNLVERAARIAFGTAVVGSVEAVNATAKQIKVLGQTIQLSSGTVFDAEIKGGLAGVAVGSIVGVHGLLDAASGVTSATRIDLRNTAQFFLLRGVVSQVNMTAKTVHIGGQTVSLSKLSQHNLKRMAQANGKVVRAVLETRQVSGQFVGRGIQSACGFVSDGRAVDIERVVTEFTSNASFKLFGLPVDSSKAVFVNPALLKQGARVQVRGALVAGVLVASTVSVKLPSGGNSLVHGAVAALDATAKTFTLDSVKVDFTRNGVVLAGSSATALMNGVRAAHFSGVDR